MNQKIEGDNMKISYEMEEENARKLRIAKLLDWVKSRQPKEYKSVSGMRPEFLGHPFLNDLLRKAIGYSGDSYLERDRDDLVERYSASNPDRYDERHEPEDLDSKFAEFLKSKFFKNLILDLGSGDRSLGYALSNALEAGGYIGVEMNFADRANKSCEKFNGDTPFAIAQEDMGRFLSDFQMTGEKLNVIIFSGIEDTSYTGIFSYSELIKNIHDILNDNGILIFAGNFGWAEGDYGEDMKRFFKQDDEWKGGGFAIYVKRKENS